MKVFTIYDSKAEVHLNPFTHRTCAEAIRAFESAANDPKSSISMYPADFTLFEIAEWDDLKAQITPHDAKISLANAIELQKKDE